MRGFTLTELLVILFIVLAVGALSIPLGVNFYSAQVLDETANDIVGTLRRASHQAVFQKHDSSFGVKFLPDLYVLFEGSSYGTRVQEQDEEFSLPWGVSVSGMDEVVFAKLAGLPNIIGTMVILSGDASRNIEINSQGKVEKQ